MEVAMQVLLPQMIHGRANFKIIKHSGKSGLFKNLPVRLRGYANWRDNWRVLVMVDRDQDDCHALKRTLEDAARQAGIATKSNPDSTGRFRVVNRIVIEELEAWFFGDPIAVGQVYHRAIRDVQNLANRGSDAIPGGTWEALQRILRRKGHLAPQSKLPKIEVARAIATHMDPTRNLSPSFQAFRQGLDALLA